MTTININEVFDTLDARRAAAQAVIAQYTAEQVAEASRVALLYDRCETTSVKHAVDTVRQLRELFGEPRPSVPATTQCKEQTMNWHIGMKPGPIVYREDGSQVADCRFEGTKEDARLIAAAPELLACLKEILDGSMDFDRYRAAINKAGA